MDFKHANFENLAIEPLKSDLLDSQYCFVLSSPLILSFDTSLFENSMRREFLVLCSSRQICDSGLKKLHQSRKNGQFEMQRPDAPFLRNISCYLLAITQNAPSYVSFSEASINTRVQRGHLYFPIRKIYCSHRVWLFFCVLIAQLCSKLNWKWKFLSDPLNLRAEAVYFFDQEARVDCNHITDRSLVSHRAIVQERTEHISH
jgi:hypothetical protein